MDQDGERCVIVDCDPITQAQPNPSEWPPIQGFDAAMVDIRWPGAASHALSAARQAGMARVLDADVAAGEVLTIHAPLASHIVGSAPGAASLSGTDDIAKATELVHSKYGCFVYVTDGANGSHYKLADDPTLRHMASPKITSVDTNGAGDMFRGVLTLAIAEGHGAERAIQFASAAASLTCTFAGGRLGAPRCPETLDFMKATYNETL